jgi:hypothetical protein
MRIFLMFGALVLVAVGIELARDPGMWRWMFPQEAGSQTQPAGEREIDFSVRFDEDEPLPPGAFRSEPAHDQLAHADRIVAQVDGGAPAGDSAGPADVAIDPAVLEPVQDNNIGIRHFERDAFFAVLAQAGEVSPQALEKAAGGHVPFSSLMNDPARYRGQPVHIEGTLRRLERRTVGENDFGVSEYWEGWMFTAESDNNPYRVVMASVPEGVPHGFTIEVPVAFTGYFFKLQGYPSNGGLHKAPVLIGPTIRPLPVREEGVPQDFGLVPYVIGFAVIIAAALGLTLWRFARSDREFGDRHVRAFTEASPEATAALRKVEAIDPDEVLRQLAAEEEG